MSNNVNALLYERARDMQDYWTGTPWARVIQEDIDRHDLEALFKHVSMAEAEASIQEFNLSDSDAF